jgi:thymidylate synthase ThyX
MPETVPLRVQLVAKTEFFPPADVPWETDADGGQALAEFAGRACYQSWSKPNPRTATNAGYNGNPNRNDDDAPMVMADANIFIKGTIGLTLPPLK